MLALLTQSPKKTATSPRKHARLGVEQLETRFCPSGLQFTNFAVVPDNNSKWVDLSGTVTDSNPSSVTVTFGGVVSGSTHADATGHFDVHLLASGLGAVTASGVDQDAASASAYATVAATAPSLTLNLAYGPNRTTERLGRHLRGCRHWLGDRGREREFLGYADAFGVGPNHGNDHGRLGTELGGSFGDCGQLSADDHAYRNPTR
jgi:hypothetical protein